MTHPDDHPAAGRGLGTLGSPGTFAGRAAAEVLRRRPRLADGVCYFPTVGAVWDALAVGTVPRVVLGARTQRNGFSGDLIRRLATPNSALFVHAEVVLGYDCHLFARPGTTMADVTQVFGHGSMLECIEFLDENLPHAVRVRHPGNSFEAAAQIAESDGSQAVVATAATGRHHGLERLASGIDGGSSACWWVMGVAPDPEEDPTCLIVAGRFDGPGPLGELVAGMTAGGWSVRTLGEVPTGDTLFESFVVLVLTGSGNPSDVERSAARMTGCRVAGAYRHDSLGSAA